MRIIRNDKLSKLARVEEARKQSIEDYFRDAVKRGLSQRDMARELDVSRQTVGNWMRALGYIQAYTFTRAKK